MDRSEWDPRSLENYDEEGNLKESLMLSPTSFPKERFTKTGESYYYTNTKEDGTVVPITNKSWSLKNLAYPLNVPFGGKKQNNLGDWTLLSWAANQALSQLAPVVSTVRGGKTIINQRSTNKAKKLFMKVDEDLNIADAKNVTPGTSTLTGTTTKGTIKPGFVTDSSGQLVSPGYDVGFRSYLRGGGKVENYPIASQAVNLLKDTSTGIASGKITKSKNYLERINEKTAIVERNEQVQQLIKLKQAGGKVTNNDMRDVMSNIGSHVTKWFDQKNQLPEVKKLKQPFLDHYKQRSNLITKFDSQIKHVLGLKGLGIDTNTGHIVSLKGDPNWKKKSLTPTSPLDVVGSNLSKYAEEGRSNRRHGELNLFERLTLQQINRPSSQMEEAIKFVNERPDLKNWTIEDEILESVKMNQLARGDTTADALELREMVEGDLKRAGLFDSSKESQILKELLIDMYTKDIVKSATDPIQLLKEGKIQPDDPLLKKKAWLSGANRRGDQSIWNQYRHDQAKKPIIDEIIRKESKLTKLPKSN
tara:strand:+ start:41 stop:1636 length:1596 start_codon:yes stop_codon:yes gene_type:complete